MPHTRPTQFTAFGMLRNQDGRILLVRRQNTGHADGALGMPGGGVEEGEDFRQAVIREIREEVGCTVKPEDCELYAIHHAMDGETERVDAQFMIHAWQGEPAICEADKADQLEWFHLDNLPLNLGDITKKVLSEEVRKKGFCASKKRAE